MLFFDLIDLAFFFTGVLVGGILFYAWEVFKDE